MALLYGRAGRLNTKNGGFRLGQSHNNGSAQQRYMARNYGAKFEYQDFAPMFTCDNFDPTAWAKLFKASGAQVATKLRDFPAVYLRRSNHRTKGGLRPAGTRRHFKPYRKQSGRQESFRHRSSRA